MTSCYPHRAAAATTVVFAIVGLASALDVPLVAAGSGEGAGTESTEILIARLVAHTTRTGVAVRATRELRAGARSGKYQGWMDVETIATPSGGFTWTVIEEGGSERTRRRIFRALLQAEADAWRAGDRDEAALTNHNYAFEPLPSARPGQVQIRVRPRRADSRLVDGTLTVSADGYPIVLEGTLAKSPSFWVKSVSIIKRFGRIGGVSLPTTIDSTADVKLVGQSTFSMRYHYHEVNGRQVTRAALGPVPSPDDRLRPRSTDMRIPR